MTVEELKVFLEDLVEKGWADTEIGTMVADIGFLPIDFIGISTENIHFMTGAEPEENE